MTDQFPPPGQPGEQPPTQMAPPSGGAPVPPYGAPGQPSQPGHPPQPPAPGYPQQPPAPGYPQPGYPQPPAPGYPAAGYPGGPGGPGYPGGPGGGFPAPPTGGGGGKKGLVIAIVAGLVVLVLGVVAVLAFTVFQGDDDKPSAKDDETSQTTDETDGSDDADEPSDEPTEESDGGDLDEVPTDDPTITARAFLDSLLEGDCLAVEGLTTPDYFASEFTDQAGCEAVAGDLEMSNAEYDFKEPETTADAFVVNVYGDVYAPSTGKTLDSTWALDGSTGSWLVSGYSYVEK